MKKVSILIALVLLVSMSSFALASGPRTTGFQIQNLGDGDAEVYIYYYNTDGSTECMDGPVTIGVGESRNWYQGLDGCIGALPGSWQGSAVIESTQPVAVIANIAEGGDYAAGAYVGTSGTTAGAPLILPAIMSGAGYFGFTTDFAIQNAGADTAACTLEFYQTGEATPDKTIPSFNVEVGASYYRNQETQDADLGANWLGVVIADCNQPMAGTINQKPLGGAAGALLTYDAVAADKIPTGDISLPVIMWNFFDFWTGLQLIATDAAGAAGTISIYDSSGVLAHSEPFTLGQYGSHVLVPDLVGGSFSGTADELYSAAIEFTSGAGTAMVNQRNMAGAIGMTYSGIYGANMTEGLSIPFGARNYYGVSTGFQVVNTGAAGDIMVYYDGSPGSGSVSTTVGPISLGAGDAVPLQQFLVGGDDPDLQGCTTCGSAGTGNRWYGSIRVVGDAGMSLSAIVNERGFDQSVVGDVGQVYNAFNYVP